MRRIWDRLRNAKTRWSAYRNVNTLTGDDLASEQMFTSLWEFASSPSEPQAIPVGLLREFNAAQRRAKSRKKFRYGSGALFTTIVLFPGLAYAGVLPPSVARVVQHILNVVSVPIHIPSATANSANLGQTTTSPSTSADPSTQATSQATSGGVDGTPNSSAAPSPSAGDAGLSTAGPLAMSENGGTDTNVGGSAAETQNATSSVTDGVSSTADPSVDGELGQGTGSTTSDASTSPDATATPDETASPDATATPDETASPDATATPDETASPDATATPDASTSPDASTPDPSVTP